MRYADDGPKKQRRVRVHGREDIGTVIQEGVNIGMNPSMYCVAVHFESTGEVAYYDELRVTTVS